MSLIDDDETLLMTRTFAATPEAVFDAWMVRDEWQAWVGPHRGWTGAFNKLAAHLARGG